MDSDNSAAPHLSGRLRSPGLSLESPAARGYLLAHALNVISQTTRGKPVTLWASEAPNVSRCRPDSEAHDVKDVMRPTPVAVPAGELRLQLPASLPCFLGTAAAAVRLDHRACYGALSPSPGPASTAARRSRARARRSAIVASRTPPSNRRYSGKVSSAMVMASPGRTAAIRAQPATA